MNSDLTASNFSLIDIIIKLNELEFYRSIGWKKPIPINHFNLMGTIDIYILQNLLRFGSKSIGFVENVRVMPLRKGGIIGDLIHIATEINSQLGYLRGGRDFDILNLEEEISILKNDPNNDNIEKKISFKIEFILALYFTGSYLEYIEEKTRNKDKDINRDDKQISELNQKIKILKIK